MLVPLCFARTAPRAIRTQGPLRKTHATRDLRINQRNRPRDCAAFAQGTMASRNFCTPVFHVQGRLTVVKSPREYVHSRGLLQFSVEKNPGMGGGILYLHLSGFGGSSYF